jgi:integrase/recombinase XerD
MTPLRKRMTEDLQLKGYSPNTQKVYLLAVEMLARHYRRSPEAITEEELRAYFLRLAKESAPSTLRIAQCGIRFCFGSTLQKNWPVLGLLRAAKQSNLPVVLSRTEVRSILGCVRAPVYRVCLNTIYSCGLRISEGTQVQVGDIDGQRQVLRVAGKGRKEREVPLAQPTLEALRAFWKLHRSKPWLFPARLQPHSPGEQGPVSVSNLRRAFRAALRQSGVKKPARVHSLRHFMQPT